MWAVLAVFEVQILKSSVVIPQVGSNDSGPEWTGIAPHAKEGFRVSKRDSGTGEGSSGRRGIIEGVHQGVIEGIMPCALV